MSLCRPSLALIALLGTVSLGARGAPAPYPGLSKLRWVGLGGGPTPDSNQVSIEQDLRLAGRVLGAPIALLYAGGPGTRAVQVADPKVQARADPLRARLGRLFFPRAARDARYRKTELSPTDPARTDTLERRLGRAMQGGETTLYVAAHGGHGEAPIDAEVQLWGGWSLGVPELAHLVAKAPRTSTLRLVMTSCYSGGFAEFIFVDGDAKQGLAPGALRCGLFATTWDRQASGCDPDPDRGTHEGYGLHFLHALRAEDRAGKALPAAAIDFDGDGVISLLEAHTRVRLASLTLDVPTTSSERWLRAVAPATGPSRPVSLPEERAVVAQLSARLGLAPKAARAKLAQAHANLDRVDLKLAGARKTSDEAWWDLSGLLLSRFPLLDDPYHPLHASALERDRVAITKILDTHPLARAYEAKRAAEQALERQADAILLRSAMVERLVRAWENLQLAGRLKAEGGGTWETFERLRACERGL